MICQKCQNNPATVKITQVIRDEKFDFFLCIECAKDLGVDDPFSDISGEIAKTIFNLIQEQIEGTTEIPDISCENCGLNIKEFTDKGLLGCADCYRNFDEYLKVLLRRYHGSNTHKKIRKRIRKKALAVDNIEILENKLHAALDREDFERAAVLRDEINQMKREK